MTPTRLLPTGLLCPCQRSVPVSPTRIIVLLEAASQSVQRGQGALLAPRGWGWGWGQVCEPCLSGACLPRSHTAPGSWAAAPLNRHAAASLPRAYSAAAAAATRRRCRAAGAAVVGRARRALADLR
eukprot:364682-Chlamydomonas_euryale.AAC.9